MRLASKIVAFATKLFSVSWIASIVAWVKKAYAWCKKNWKIVLGAVFGFLCLLLGIERGKVKKQKAKVKDARTATSLSQIAQKSATKALETKKTLDTEKAKKIKEVEGGKTNEEVIKTANDNVDSFNAGN